MQTTVSSEKTYTVGFFKPGQKGAYGISVNVAGDKKTKVLREAKELLEKVQADALAVHTKYFGEKPKEED